jgi:hypothetical protein
MTRRRSVPTSARARSEYAALVFRAQAMAARAPVATDLYEQALALPQREQGPLACTQLSLLWWLEEHAKHGQELAPHDADDARQTIAFLRRPQEWSQ